MATFTWPAGILPQTATPWEPADVLRSIGLTGRMQTRPTLNRAWTWTETYPPFKANTPEGAALLAAVTRCTRDADEASKRHELYATGLGGNAGTATINGAGQTGSTLSLAITGTNPVLRAGEFIRVPIAGVFYLFQVTADANQTAGIASVSISPTIIAGNSPANGATVFTFPGQGVQAKLLEATQLPRMRPGYWVDGLTLRWLVVG